MAIKKLFLLSFLHALGLVLYVAAVVVILKNGGRIFGSMNDFFGPFVFLTLFVLSAAITGALVLARPVMLFLENKKADAVKMFLSTIGWIFVIAATILILNAKR